MNTTNKTLSDDLSIQTGEKRITVNGDPDRTIIFNPDDVIFAEKFYELVGDFEKKLLEYQAQSKEMSKVKAVDGNGLPVNLAERLALVRVSCEYIRSGIDHLFGPDTSQKAFGDTLALEVFPQFFAGITPYIQAARAKKVDKYLPPAGGRKRHKSKVMK